MDYKFEMKCQLLSVKWWFLRKLEEMQIAIAWALPRKIVMWATIRVFAHATTGKHGNTDVTSLTYPDLMKRWEEPN